MKSNYLSTPHRYALYAKTHSTPVQFCGTFFTDSAGEAERQAYAEAWKLYEKYKDEYGYPNYEEILMRYYEKDINPVETFDQFYNSVIKEYIDWSAIQMEG